MNNEQISLILGQDIAFPQSDNDIKNIWNTYIHEEKDDSVLNLFQRDIAISFMELSRLSSSKIKAGAAYAFPALSCLHFSLNVKTSTTKSSIPSTIFKPNK